MEEEQQISVEVAILANEKGYDWGRKGWCFLEEDGEEYYTNVKGGIGGKQSTFKKTGQSLLKRWLREKHKIYIEIAVQEAEVEATWYWKIFTNNAFTSGLIWITADSNGVNSPTYEDALEVALKEGLKLIK